MVRLTRHMVNHPRAVPVIWYGPHVIVGGFDGLFAPTA